MKKTRPKTKTETIAAIAAGYRCDQRTVQRWEAAGAPLNDPKRMRAWLASRKNLPVGTLQKLRDERQAERASANETQQPVPRGERGAPFALVRLEDSEVEAYVAYRAAIATGNEIQIRLTEKHWSNRCGQLLKFDAAISENRRGNDLIEKAAVEKALRTVGHLLALNLPNHFQKLPASLDGASIEKISALLDEAVRSCVKSATAFYVGTQSSLAPWAVAALTSGFETLDGGSNPWPPEQIERTRELLAYLAKLTTEQIRAQATSAAAAIRAGSSRDREEFLEWQRERRRNERREYLARCVALGAPVFGLEDWEAKEFPTLEKFDAENPNHIEGMTRYNEKTLAGG